MVSGIIVFPQFSCYMVTLKIWCEKKSWTVIINWPVIPTTLDRISGNFHTWGGYLCENLYHPLSPRHWFSWVGYLCENLYHPLSPRHWFSWGGYLCENLYHPLSPRHWFSWGGYLCENLYHRLSPRHWFSHN